MSLNLDIQRPKKLEKKKRAGGFFFSVYCFGGKDPENFSKEPGKS